jgi:hypothetical protein
MLTKKCGDGLVVYDDGRWSRGKQYSIYCQGLTKQGISKKGEKKQNEELEVFEGKSEREKRADRGARCLLVLVMIRMTILRNAGLFVACVSSAFSELN